jgi:RNA-directed DNA polymerase
MRWRDRFPPMIVERCLTDSADLITDYIKSAFAGGKSVPSEVLTMPRAGFGPRPVTITDLPSRLLYGAMVAALDNSLSPPTRGNRAWDQYQRFGLDEVGEYVVEMDIASCYEYIDHNRLKSELVVRSMNLDVCTALTNYLGELLSQTRGLPQMLTASDRLADTYLSIFDRKMRRDGYSIRRYVDDIRVTAQSWEHANLAIEQAAQYARDLGLILSSRKTSIYKPQTLIDQQEQEAALFNSHVDAAREALSGIWFVAGYDSMEEIEITSDDQEAALAAAWKILAEWWDDAKKRGPQVGSSSPAQRFINRGLFALREYDKRLPANMLADIVFHDPRKIENVVKYLIGYAELRPEERDLRGVALLTSQGRQSAWAKLWILHAVENLAPDNLRDTGAVGTWVKNQLDDRHEIVRAQAAWLSSMQGWLTSEKLAELYKRASPISQPGLSAAGVRQGNIAKGMISAITSDSALNREASKWAEATTV